MLYKKVIVLFLLALMIPTDIVRSSVRKNRVSFYSHDVSPWEYGLVTARNGVERYECLYKAHCAAIEAGVNVSYKGIDSLQIEIPKDAKSIPLTVNNDFGGLVLIVRNDAKSHSVFEMVQESFVLDIKKERLDSGVFSDIPLFSERDAILVLEDQKPWVRKRRGYEYGATRKDLLIVENGIARNSTVAGYSNSSSDPLVKYFFASAKTKTISNITFIRDSSNTMRAYLFNILNQYDVVFNNIKCETPYSDLVYDQIIRLENCGKITFRDVTINGTYSTHKKAGYGISMDNIYDVTFYRLKANANWGIFGNNNVNSVTLKKCDINRFDIHCYGKDITFEDCKFRDLYNQFSSIYGKVSFNNCEFFNFIPILFESSYNAYTKFDLVFKNCTIHASREKNYLISGGDLKGGKTEERFELAQQEYPNLYIDGLNIYMPDDVDVYYIYKFRKDLLQFQSKTVQGLLRMKGIKFIPSDKKSLEMVDPQSWMTALEIGALTMLGSGLLVVGYNTYNHLRGHRSSISA